MIILITFLITIFIVSITNFHDVSNNGCEKIGGCIINYRKILKRYLFKTHDRWHECYSINKTSISKNYSGVTEIVELKSK